MIITKLTGGLGNQLFQYAHGKAHAIKNGASLGLDISWYKGRIDRAYMLDVFTIDAKIATMTDKIFTRLFSPRNYKVGDWQSEKYFKNITNIIRKEFTLKDPLSPAHTILLNEIKGKNAVSIHLRGGDYVRGKKSSFHGTCSPEYYASATNYIHSHINSPHFFIFTDDISWAKNHIQFPEPYTLVEADVQKPHEELALMSACKHTIIANSTFSWWGAWLNNNSQKIVIAPQKWFNDSTIDTKDVIPPTWIKM